MLAEEANNSEGVAETDVILMVFPKPDFDRLVAEEETFRKFVFTSYSRRLIGLLRVVYDVGFGRIDMRVAERFLRLVEDRNGVQTTHQMLASELETGQEVILHA